MNLTKQQITENEMYFSNVLNTLAEGGVFGWKDLNEVLVKRNGKLVCPQKAYDTAKDILSAEFFKNNFELNK